MPSSLVRHCCRPAAASWRAACPRVSMRVGLHSALFSSNSTVLRKPSPRMTVLSINALWPHSATALTVTCASLKAANDAELLSVASDRSLCPVVTARRRRYAVEQRDRLDHIGDRVAQRIAQSGGVGRK